MAQQAIVSDYVCFGDHIFLLDDDHGVAQCQGFGDDVNMGIASGKSAGTFSNQAVFTVRQQYTLNAATHLKDFEDSQGSTTSRRTARGTEAQYKKLENDARTEAKRNADEYETIKGREIRYGMIITLRHEGSTKFLAISAQSAESNRDSRKVCLTGTMSDDVYFRVMPQLGRVHSEGERIHDRDPVQLESVSNVGLKLSVSYREMHQHGQPWHEMLASTEPSPFKLQRFRSQQVESSVAAFTAKPLLLGGQAVRLLHVEANAYVQGKCDSRETSLLRSAEMSSNLIFQVERLLPRDGSSFVWGAECRLRHIGTGSLLAVPANPTFDKDQTAPTIFNEPSNEDGSIFMILPQYASQQGNVVNMGSLLQLKHVATGCWLHCPTPGADGDKMELRVDRVQQEADVFRFEEADEGVVRDMLYAKNAIDYLTGFLEQPITVSLDEQERMRLAKLEGVLTELICFCSLSDNLDPMTREGLPKPAQQQLLSELLAMDRAMAIVEKIIPVLQDAQSKPGRGSTFSTFTVLQRTATLCQRLMRLCLRQNPNTCSYAAERPKVFVGPLRDQMGYGILAAETLREIYVDNTTLLEKITPSDIKEILDLIRSQEPGKGRKARYIEFLMVLCECDGKAVRVNQWKIADQLFTPENEQLFLKLHSDPNDGVVVSGNPTFFPTFRADNGSTIPKLPLSVWLDAKPKEGSTPEQMASHREVRNYFENTINLFKMLVLGRNRRNTQHIRQLLPYSLVEAVITSKDLHRAVEERDDNGLRIRHPRMKLCAAFAGIVRCLYVDSYVAVPGQVEIGEPHEMLARVKMMRIWDNVERIEESGKLASRVTTRVQIDFDYFKGLQIAMYNFLRENAASQIATRVEMNVLIEQLLHLLYDMIRFGFVLSGIKSSATLEQEAKSSAEQARTKFRNKGRASLGGAAVTNWRASTKGYVAFTDADDSAGQATIPPLLGENEQPSLRRFIPVLLRVLDGRGDTMHEDQEAGDDELGASVARYKPWATKTMNTVTVMNCKIWACRTLQCICTVRVDLRLSKLLRTYKEMFEDGVTLQPQAEEASSSTLMIQADKVASAYKNAKERFAVSLQILKIPQIQRVEWLFDVLLDCMNYEKPELTEVATGLLIRHFEQKRVLADNLKGVQLLVVERMKQMYSLFEELLRRLNLLASRRRLVDDDTQSPPLDESFQTVQTLMQLTSWLYDDGDPTESRDSSDTLKPSNVVSQDHTASIYLRLVGKARVEVGKSVITVEKLASCLQVGETGERTEAMLRKDDQIQLEGMMYTVIGVKSETGLVELDRKFSWPPEPAELAKRKGGVVWIMLLRPIRRYDRDLQLMVLNLQKGAILKNAMQLLSLGFDASKIAIDDLNTRAVMRAVYRFLKAFVSKFPSGQAFMAPYVSRFLPHCEANLVSTDISPMGFINMIFKDNHINCASIDPKVVKFVVNLAAQLHPPRMLRFLSSLVEAKGKVIASNQLLVVQELDKKDRAMVLFAEPDERKELEQLIASKDHRLNPRGMLVYHIELINLLALVTKNDRAVQNRRWIRTRLSLTAITRMLELHPMPPTLQAAYLSLFRNVFLSETKLSVAMTARGEADTDSFGKTEQVLRAMLDRLTATLHDGGEAGIVSKQNPVKSARLAPVPVAVATAEELAQTEFVLFDSLLPTLECIYYKYNQDLLAEDDEERKSILVRLAVAIERRGATRRDVSSEQREYMNQVRDCFKHLPSVIEEREADEALRRGLIAKGIEPRILQLGTKDALSQSVGDPLKISIPGKQQHEGARSDSTGDARESAGGKSPRHPQTNLSDFADTLITTDEVDGEFEGLVELFKYDIEEMGGVSTRRLIEQLAPTTFSSSGSLDNEHQQTRTCLRLLARLVVSGSGTATERSDGHQAGSQRHRDEMRRLQCLLNSMGASAVALSMSACEDDDLCESGLELCCALLGEGNSEVQNTMHQLLSGPEQVKAFDGSKTTFLASMRDRLRLGSKEIIERKLYVEQQQTILNDSSLIQQETAGLGAAAKKRYLDNLSKPYSSRAKVMSVLRTLQLLCEGHNSTVQDYLRMQPDEPTNVDLVFECYDLLENLISKRHGTNLDQLLQCLKTLSELVQGNLSGGNATMLMDTKLFEHLDELLFNVTSSASKSIKSSDVRKLKREVSVLLVALVDSETKIQGLAQDQVLRKVHLDKLADLVQECYDQSVQTALILDGIEWEDAKAELQETGANIYIVIRYLVDYEMKLADEAARRSLIQVPSESRMLQELSSFREIEEKLNGRHLTKEWRVQPEARQHHARLVGSVEICNAHGTLKKCYFPIPTVCLKLLDGNEHAFPKAEQLKDRTELLLWGLEEVKESGGDKAVREHVHKMNAQTATMHTMKKELLWGVDRAKQGTLLHDFVQGVDELHLEMSHLDRLQQWPLWNFLSRHKKTAFESTFQIACLQNIVLLARYSLTVDHPAYMTLENVANDFMGGLQVMSCIFSFGAVAIQSGPLLLKRKALWRDQDGFHKRESSLWDQWDEHRALLLERTEQTSIWKWAELYFERLWLHARVLVVLLSNLRLFTALVLMIAALLGLFVSPLWFSLHLVDVVNKSSDLQYVFRSVTTHGRSIVWTAFFGSIVIYIYAVAGIGLLPSKAFKETVPSPAFDGHEKIFSFGRSDGEIIPSSEDDPHASRYGQDASVRGGRNGRMMEERASGFEYCDSLIVCWLSVMNEGLRAGDIGTLMFNPDPTDDWNQYLLITLYQFSFYCIVITILLSIIFGIIVDTFSQLRTEEQEKRKHMDGVCFICGVDRLTLDTKGGGFDKHIQTEHNMWNYAFMLIHIREKDPLEHNGWESDVYSKLMDDDYSFIPSKDAISLREYNERRRREASQLFDKVTTMQAQLDGTAKQLKALSEQTTEQTAQLQQVIRETRKSPTSSSRNR